MHLRRTIATLTVAALAATTLHLPALAAPVRHAPHKKPAASPAACGGAASLFVNTSTAAQGSLILATVAAKSPLTNVHAKWGTHDISFWPSAPNPASPPQAKLQIWHALIPVDLEESPGDLALSVEIPQAPADPVTCQLTIHVNPGKFATENLKVAPQFVEPNPEQLARAKNEAQRLREIYATATPNKLWQGKFRVPLAGITSGANFGRRRVLNGQPSSPHTGVDFPAPTGTPVRAAQAGRVVLAEPLYFAGNTVVIDHGLGIYTLYGHLSEISVKAGDQLPARALLGKVGATGRVTGPHLHWGLTIAGARVNALQIVNFPAL